MKKSKKNKILIVLSGFPYPATDGTKFKILYNICLPLKEHFDLEYLIISLKKIPENDLKDFETQYGKVHLFYKNKFLFFVSSLQSLINLYPFQVNGFQSKKVKLWIKKNIHQYKVVYIHTIRTSVPFIELKNNYIEKIIFDFNDALSLNYHKSKIFARFPYNFIYFIEENLIRSYERKMMRIFNNFNVVSEYDKKYLLSLRKITEQKNIYFESIPHGIEKSNVVRKDVINNRIYFIGSLGYEMNINAIEFFINELWFPLKLAIPEIELYIIGGGQAELQSKYRNIKDIYFTGYLKNIDPIITKCSCLVAPILSGAGMPTKIIEAMSFGIPCITTPVGARGIYGLEHAKNIYICDEKDKDLWISTIKRLTSDLDFNYYIGQNAFLLFEENYELLRVKQKWVDFFLKVITKNS